VNYTRGGPPIKRHLSKHTKEMAAGNGAQGWTGARGG